MARALSLIAYAAFSSRPEAPVKQMLTKLQRAGTITDEALNQRLAQKAPPRPLGNLIWFNAGSEHAIAPCFELFRRLREDRPDLRGIITTTYQSHVPHDVPKGLLFMQAPEDRLTIIRRFLTHWDPDCLIWVGGGFRPALIEKSQSRGIPTVSIDAPESTHSLALNKIIPGLKTATMCLFEHVFAANITQSIAWQRAGLNSENIEVLGYLGEGATVPQFDETELEALSEDIGTRPVWFAANIGPAEIRDVVRAHKVALRRAHRLLLIVSAQDAESVRQLQAHCANQGLTSAARADNKAASDAVQVLIVNAGTEDGLWYRLAPVTFLGQSITDGGGCDPYPAAIFGSAIIHGPNVSYFSSRYARFDAANAARLVTCGDTLGETVSEVSAPDYAANMASAAWEICSEGAEMTDRVASLAHDILDLREEMLA